MVTGTSPKFQPESHYERTDLIKAVSRDESERLFILENSEPYGIDAAEIFVENVRKA